MTILSVNKTREFEMDAVRPFFVVDKELIATADLVSLTMTEKIWEMLQTTAVTASAFGAWQSVNTYVGCYRYVLCLYTC